MTEMGLAVVQQLKSFEPSFEPGALAGLFDQVGKTQQDRHPILHLVENVERNFSYATDFGVEEKADVGHSTEHSDYDSAHYREDVLNIEDFTAHAEDTTFKYGVKELMKTPQGHDLNVVADNGYIKLGNISPEGYIQKKQQDSWRSALQLAMNLQRDESRLSAQRLAEQLDALKREIQALRGVQDFLKDKTDDDFNDGSQKAEENRAELERRLNEVEGGKTIADFTDENGDVDIEAANNYAREREKQARDQYQNLEKEHEAVLANKESSVSKLAAVKQIDDVNTDSFFETADDSSDPEADAENSASVQGYNSPASSPAVVAAAPSDVSNMLPDFAFSSANDETQNDVVTPLKAQNDAAAAVPVAERARSLASVASSMEGEDTRVLSQSFTELAAGLIKTPAQTQEMAPVSSKEQKYAVMQVG